MISVKVRENIKRAHIGELNAHHLGAYLKDDLRQVDRQEVTISQARETESLLRCQLAKCVGVQVALVCA